MAIGVGSACLLLCNSQLRGGDSLLDVGLSSIDC